MSEYHKITSPKLLVLPTWLSGLISIACALAVTAGSMIISAFHNSALQQELFQKSSQSATPGLSSSYESVSGSFLNNNFVGDLTLFVIWGLVGLVVYMFIYSVWNAFQNAVHIRKELDYIHSDRD